MQYIGYYEVGLPSYISFLPEEFVCEFNCLLLIYASVKLTLINMNVMEHDLYSGKAYIFPT